MALPPAANATPQTLRFGPPGSEVSFRAYGLGLLPIDVHFGRFEGSLSYDPANGASCHVELHVDVASLIADDAAMRSRITGPEFMDAATYPMLAYSGRCQAGDRLDGNLAMHGVTKPFDLALEWRPEGVVAEGRLQRAEWGMTALPLLGGRTIRIRVAVPLPPKPATPPESPQPLDR